MQSLLNLVATSEKTETKSEGKKKKGKKQDSFEEPVAGRT